MSLADLSQQKDEPEWPKLIQFWPLYFFAVILILLLCLLYYQVLFTGKGFYYRDTLYNYRVFYTFIRQSLFAGHFPFWNPFLYAGVPQFSIGEPPLFYFPGWLMFTGLPYSLTLVATLILHQVWTGMGVFYLGRLYHWQTISCWIAALSWSLSGVMVSMNSLHPLLMTVAWVPWVFVSLHQLGQGKLRIGSALFGICYTLQVLSGHLEIVYFETLLLFIYFFVLFFKANVFFLKTSLCCVGIGLISVALGMLQLLPSLYFSGDSVRRGGVGLEIAQQWSVHPILAYMMTLPALKGSLDVNDSLSAVGGEAAFGYTLLFPSLYLGVAAILFAIFALFDLAKNKIILAWLCLLVFSFLLAMGKYLPFYAFFYDYLPGMCFFRYPIKLLVFVNLGIAVLAGWGFNQLKEGTLDMKKKLYLTIYPLCWLSLFLFAYFQQSRLVAWLFAQISRIDTYSYETQQNWSQLTGSAIQQQFLQVTVLVVLLCVLQSFYFLKPSQRVLIGTLIISVIAFDLLSSGVNLVWTAERAAFETKPELVSVLENAKLKEDPQFRYRILPHSGTIPDSFMPQLKNATIFYNALYIYQTLQVNFGSEWGFRHAMGLWPGNTFKNSVFQDAFNQSDEKKRLDIALSLEQILAVKYLLTSNPTEDMLHNYLQSSDYRLFYRSDQTETFIFELKNPVPRARFTRNSIQTEHEENMLEAISRARELGFDFSDQVLLLKQESFSAVQQVPAEEDDVYRSVAPVLSEQGPNQVTVTLETPFSGYLVLADQWLPGWSAFEHAEERPILLANYMQRAVRLPPGKHQIKFKYEAPGFKFAVIISLLGLFLFLLSLWWLPVQIRQPERN